MESLQTIEKLNIETNKVFYDKKTEVLSVYLPDFVFIGNYKKSTRIEKILDDILKSLGETKLSRQRIAFVDFVTLQPIPEKMKLKQLKLISKKQKELEEEKKEEEKKLVQTKDVVPVVSEVKEDKVKNEFKKRKKSIPMPSPQPAAKAKKKERAYDMEETDEILIPEEEEELFREERYDDLKEMEDEPEMAPPKPAKPAMVPAAPPSPPGAGAPARTISPSIVEKEKFLGGLPKADVAKEDQKPIPRIYEINMGLQYYSVMMEQTSYLFYVYFSHKELKIVDEEGKTVFETSFVIKTTKKEPPILNLRVEGEGFEVHPLYGKVVVSKDAINPPVMIFSVLPTKNKNRGKKEKKEGERRHLHVYVDFEEKVINHSILSIIVQPKHFHVDIGPIHLDISKKAAMIISFLSIIVAGVSLIYTIFSIDPSSTFTDFISSFAPGLGSIIFVGIFLYTLFKEGIYPLKEKISYFLNFDKTGTLIK